MGKEKRSVDAILDDTYDRYVAMVGNEACNRMRDFTGTVGATTIEITHRLASSEWLPEREPLEKVLLRKAPGRFVLARIMAVEPALKHAAGIDLDTRIPDGSMWVFEPEAHRTEPSQTIAGVLAIPFEARGRRSWFSIAGYYLKQRVSSGIAQVQVQGMPMVYPVVYAVDATESHEQKVNRYFPQHPTSGTYAHASDGAEWRLIDASSPLRNLTVLQAVYAACNLFMQRQEVTE